MKSIGLALLSLLSMNLCTAWGADTASDAAADAKNACAAASASTREACETASTAVGATADVIGDCVTQSATDLELVACLHGVEAIRLPQTLTTTCADPSRVNTVTCMAERAGRPLHFGPGTGSRQTGRFTYNGLVYDCTEGPACKVYQLHWNF